jgi:hypothetical protein
VDVGVHDSRHLRLLDGADLAVRVHDEDGHILLAAQAVDGRRAGITTCRANDGQMLPVASGLALVLADEEVLEQVAQELQRDILEREGGPVEELEQMYVLLLVERDGRRDVFCAECRVAAVDDVFEVCGRYLGRRDVEGEDLVCEIREREVLPARRPVVGEAGDLLRDEQPAVGGEAFQYDFLKGELLVSGRCFGVAIDA